MQGNPLLAIVDIYISTTRLFAQGYNLLSIVTGPISLPLVARLLHQVRRVLTACNHRSVSAATRLLIVAEVTYFL